MPSKPKLKKRTWWDDIVYDLVLWIFNIVVDLFFREVHPRTSYRIPRSSPVIFVAAPHANQFVDPLILGSTVRHEAKRRISFLIAEKSMRRRFVGFAAGSVGSVSVGRALDLKKPAKGKIWLSDPDGDACMIRGSGVAFDDEKVYMVGGLLVLPSVNNTAANAEIGEIVSKEEISLKKPFKGDVAYKQLTGKDVPEDDSGNLANGKIKSGSDEYEGTPFQVAPHIDQSAVYDQVFQRLKDGGCIGIFPEGGSHDRTELLPIKPGVAIMALGALAEDPRCGISIVPVGMNYFHPHKFRSRAVIEFGKPITVDPNLVEKYKNGDRRDAVKTLLDTVFQGLQSVTTLAPDYDTLMLIQAVRRLYNPKGKELPLSMVVELNRRLMKGYETFKNDPRVKGLSKDVLDYNSLLFRLHIRDHQVGYAKHPWYWTISLLVYRILKLLTLSIAVLPGTVLFAPIFITGKLISIKKSKEALAASTVKIRARDVIATWKILVTLALTPILDILYTSILTWWTYYNRVGGRVPSWLPLKAVALGGLIFFPAVCFMALRFGEVGMDILKSLRPLFLSINPSSSNSFYKLNIRRENLTKRINDLIDELGPELFPDFEKYRIIQDEGGERPQTPTTERSSPATPTESRFGHRREGSELDALSFTPPSLRRHLTNPAHIPRNESFKNFGSIGIFASRPSTPNQSRSRAGSGSESSHSGHAFGSGLRGMTSMEPAPTGKEKGKAKADLDEVSRNLQAAMRERGRRRKSEGEESGEWVELEEGRSGRSTPANEDGESRKDV